MIINSAYSSSMASLSGLSGKQKMKCRRTNNSSKQDLTDGHAIAPTQNPKNHKTALDAELDKNLLVQRVQKFNDATLRDEKERIRQELISVHGHDPLAQ